MKKLLIPLYILVGATSFFSACSLLGSETKKIVYVTLDDGPSPDTGKKVDWFVEHNIPAILFFRGCAIEKHEEEAIYAIQNGFLIGNHSFSHPHFSEISYEEGVKEIERTEQLIDQAYEKAGVERLVKVFRFPFGDRGDRVAEDEIAADTSVQAKKDRLQEYLKDAGFKRLVFAGAEPVSPELLDNIDAYWTLDVRDWDKSLFEDPLRLIERVREKYSESQQEAIVLLMHDFAHRTYLWQPIMEALLKLDPDFQMSDVAE